jgi:potassium efflux system protein
MDKFTEWTWRWLPEIWGLEIFNVDGQTITLGKLFTGILLYVLGYFICRTLSKEFENRLLSKLQIENSLKHTLKTVFFYFLITILALFVLRLLNVPITIFAVLGGALAIGLGFGSQNIVNNFVSGLLLMIERPVRVGDIIETEGIKGTVENIGMRSTLIKSADNTHFVVPNSFFIEKSVLNWTLSDDVIRSKIVVGVGYNSPVRIVERLLYESISRSDKILQEPKPLVFFSDFGDNSLIFEVCYWTQVSEVLDVKSIQSFVRFQIEQLFRENGIIIAYPQRDIHLDTNSPLKIQLIKNKSDSQIDL